MIACAGCYTRRKLLLVYFTPTLTLRTIFYVCVRCSIECTIGNERSSQRKVTTRCAKKFLLVRCRHFRFAAQFFFVEQNKSTKGCSVSILFLICHRMINCFRSHLLLLSLCYRCFPIGIRILFYVFHIISVVRRIERLMGKLDS